MASETYKPLILLGPNKGIPAVSASIRPKTRLNHRDYLKL